MDQMYIEQDMDANEDAEIELVQSPVSENARQKNFSTMAMKKAP